MEFDEAYDALAGRLPLTQDRETHKRDYWVAAQCHDLPELVQMPVYEVAARHGHDIALRLLHQALDDGITGQEPFDKPALFAMHCMNPERLYVRFLVFWLYYLFEQPEWRVRGRFWTGWVGGYLLASHNVRR